MSDYCKGEGLFCKQEGGGRKNDTLEELFGKSVVAKRGLRREKTPLVTVNREKQILFFGTFIFV